MGWRNIYLVIGQIWKPPKFNWPHGLATWYGWRQRSAGLVGAINWNETNGNVHGMTGFENKDLQWGAKISSRYASILKQFAIALELFNKKSLECQLHVWLCEQFQTAHFSGVKCIFSGAFAPELQTIFNRWAWNDLALSGWVFKYNRKI
jgi:hypothetical protein